MFNVTGSPTPMFDVQTRTSAQTAQTNQAAQAGVAENQSAPGATIPKSIDRASISSAAKEMSKAIGDAAQSAQEA